MSSAEPSVPTAGGNESDTTEQGRSEASSSSKDTTATNDTSREGEGAPVKDDKYPYITWTKTISSKKRFKTKYTKECNELRDLVARLWPKLRGYHPEIILRYKDGSNYLVDVAESDEQVSEEKFTLLPQGELPSCPKLEDAIGNLTRKLRSLDKDKSWVAADQNDDYAVAAEIRALLNCLKAISREHRFTPTEPSETRVTWDVFLQKREGGKDWQSLGAMAFDSKRRMLLWTKWQLRKALFAPEDPSKNERLNSRLGLKSDIRVEKNAPNEYRLVRKRT